MRVYICSPFFNDEEIERVKKMEEFLEDRGYSVYSPMRDGIMLTKDADSEIRLSVYKENIKEVLDADLAIVITATPDTGTAVEEGVKIGQWETRRLELQEISSADPAILNEDDKAILNQECPRIITFADNGKKVNVMLQGAVLRHCLSFEELGEYLDYADRVGIKYAKRDIDSLKKIEVY